MSPLPGPFLEPVASTTAGRLLGGFSELLAEERLWFLDQLAPGNPFYNIPLAWRLRGRVEVPALAQSLDRIVERHEVLRTCFPPRAGRLAAREALIAFDLSRDRLLRATLVLIDDEQAALLLTIHHIVADGWSMGVLLCELQVLYEARTTGRPAALPELPVQYADFAVRQRQWLRGEVLEEQLAYWRRRLTGVSAWSCPGTGRGRRSRSSAEAAPPSTCRRRRASGWRRSASGTGRPCS